YNGATRDSPDSFLGGFSSHRGVRHFFHAKLNGAMLAINITFQRGWTHLWLEIDSQLVLKAFSNSCMVPWSLCLAWTNVASHWDSISFRVSNI
ncbi:hypothetical protein glysoja_039085, partial [Glycine soja]